jgi:hypothetical protein
MSEETKPNRFTKKREITDAPLHSTEDFDEVRIPHSFSLYRSDKETIALLVKDLKKFNKKKLSESIIARVAVAYLKEAYDKGGQTFEKDIKRLINEHK